MLDDIPRHCANSASPHIVFGGEDPLVAGMLSRAGFRVSVATDTRVMDLLLSRKDVELLLLDLALVKGEEHEIRDRVRLLGDVPVILLSIRADESDRVRGLETGADDYLTKPCSHRELIARIRAVLRRCARRRRSTSP